MQFLNQQKPSIAGPNKSLGEICDIADKPIDALRTVLCQLEAAKEWNVESAKEEISKAEQSIQGIELTLSLAVMALEGVIAALEAKTVEYDLLVRKVSHGCTDATCSECDKQQ